MREGRREGDRERGRKEDEEMECPWGSGAQISRAPHAPDLCPVLCPPTPTGELGSGVCVDQGDLPCGLLPVAQPQLSLDIRYPEHAREGGSRVVPIG